MGSDAHVQPATARGHVHDVVREGALNQSVKENNQPLAGFGITAWQDDDWTHSVLRLTTD